jgi:hypothetical protein
MTRERTRELLLAFLAGLVVCLFAPGVPAQSTKSHVVEKDVTLEDEPDEEAAPKKKKPVEEEPEDEEEDKTDRLACKSDLDCDGKDVCKNKHCVPPSAAAKEEPAQVDSSPAVWLAVGLMQDLTIMTGGQVCTQASQVSGGFTCIRASGSQYHGTPLPGAAGDVGGIALAATRATLASYFRLADSFSAGVRLGYAFLGQGPRPDGGHDYLAFSAEGQGAYWFSKRAFSTKVVGTFVELSAGMAQVDGKQKVTVKEDPSAPPPVSQTDNPPQQTLDAWKKSGAAFAGAGVGLFLPFGAGSGLIADLRIIQLFPSAGTALSLGVSGALGL